MRVSEYFLPTLKETPAEAQIASHRLMLRAGMVKQASAGIYSWLPLGFRVLQNIENIVRTEMNAVGAIEMLMPTLQSADLWRESGRYEDYGAEMLRIKDRHENDLLYGPTNEELITRIFGDAVKSYRHCPRILYHTQWKFRDEIRPRFGVMRGREFLMKDAYSFDVDEGAARHSYHKMFVSYLRAFAAMGLTAIPVAADAGPIGGDMSHEFVVLAATGESEVHCHRALLDRPLPDSSDAQNLATLVEGYTSLYARSDEMHDASLFAAQVSETDRVVARAIEVGHIFCFGDKYTKAMGCALADSDGRDIYPHCGSYGIGISRLVGAIIEASHDDKGIIWPWEVAPFRVGIIALKGGDEAAKRLYDALGTQGVSVLYDDRNESAGVKFADMELIGLPWQAVIGAREAEAGKVSLTPRAGGEKQLMDFDAAVQALCHPPNMEKS